MWNVSTSPHVRSSESVEKIMWTVTACLVPPLILSVFVFGIQVLLITGVSVISCMAVEAVSQKALGRPVTVRDGSAALTGMRPVGEIMFMDFTTFAMEQLVNQAAKMRFMFG